VAEKQLHEELLHLTEELIRIPSTHSRPQEIHNCADFIGKWLKGHGLAYRKNISGGIPTILVVPDSETASVPVLFMSHFDVVEGGDEDLFVPRIDGDRLYGRGAIDDKYGVALSLLLYRQLYRKYLSLGRSPTEIPLALMFTGDEEIGGEHGAGHAAHQISPQFFLAIDGGRPDLIVTREKGILQLELTAHGTAAHAARPWLGHSAFDILTADYYRMQELFGETSSDHWHRTMVLSKCHAGNGSTNIVPEKATAFFDIRYTEKDNAQELVAAIRTMVDSTVTVRALEPVFEGGTSPYLDLLVSVSDGAAVGFEHGASDARYLSQRGIPGAIWGADGGMSQHSRNEHIVISSMFKMYDQLEGYLNRIQ